MQSKNKPARALGSCKSLCCNCRLSGFSSSSEPESERYPSISSLAHAMVQERLDQMIKERQVVRRQRSRRSYRDEGSKFIVMMAVEKCSYDPRQDFKVSMEQIITSNRIHKPQDLRRLLNYYVSMNSEEHIGVILEVFHDVCTDLFLSCKPDMHRRNNYHIL